jgi:hypothetical protein
MDIPDAPAGGIFTAFPEIGAGYKRSPENQPLKALIASIGFRKMYCA